MALLEHKAISESTEEAFNEKLNEASADGWVLSSQFGVSMTSVVVDNKEENSYKNKVVMCYHIMVSKRVEQAPKKTGKNIN